MKCLLCVVVSFCFTGLFVAGGEAKPRLTPRQVEEGWLLLFDGETTFGWTAGGGKATVKDGILSVQADKAERLLTTTAFGWGQAEVELRWQGKSPPVPVVQGDTAAILGKGAKPGTWYFLSGNSDPDSYEVTAKGIFLERGMRKKKPATTRGQFGFEIPAGTTLEIRSCKFKPLGLKPIFNGKDLTGWKEFPGQKSKFSVTPEGWLNVKNGKGDLQTVDKWADFTLQLECISNGDFLNSGIFFRCQPDKYQQGYEAQIHNNFLKKPKTYVLEDFDPKTHQSLGKRKAEYLADDYGTGAIYRRIPARKQMAKDRAWFGMTVIAEGRHLGVWVNGVMVTDWTDNRTENANGRNGFRAAAGPISIQGHDPTTDLSFRNIRIAELPKGK